MFGYHVPIKPPRLTTTIRPSTAEIWICAAHLDPQRGNKIGIPNVEITFSNGKFCIPEFPTCVYIYILYIILETEQDLWYWYSMKKNKLSGRFCGETWWWWKWESGAHPQLWCWLWFFWQIIAPSPSPWIWTLLNSSRDRGVYLWLCVPPGL